MQQPEARDILGDAVQRLILGQVDAQAACADIDAKWSALLLREKRGLSAEIAVRLAMVLRTTPETWMRMQQAVDIWELEGSGKYNKIVPVQIAA